MSQTEFHLFHVHSHIMYLVAKATIARLGLRPDQCAFTMSRNYKTPDDKDGVPRYAFPFPNWDLKFYYHEDYRKVRANITELESWIGTVTQNRPFRFYAQTTLSYYVCIIATMKQCLAYSFIEEGSAVYCQAESLPQSPMLDSVSVDRELMGRCNDKRLIEFDYEYLNASHPKFHRAYCVHESAFPMVPAEKKVVLKNVFQKIPISEFAGADALLVIGDDRRQSRGSLENYERLYDRIAQELAVRKHRRVLYKLRVTTKPEDLAIYRKVFARHPGIDFTRLPDALPLENVVASLDVPVYHCISSVGLYATQLGRKVICFGDAYAEIEPKYVHLKGYQMLRPVFRATDCEFPRFSESPSAPRTNDDKVYSFDIFDTLITRTTASPKGVFMLIQARLANEYVDKFPQHLVRCYAQHRQLAERLIRRQAPSYEVMFDDIHLKLKQQFRLSDEQVRILKKLEIDTEIDVSRGIKENIEKAEKLLSQGRRVVLITNMYLPTPVLTALLEKSSPLIARNCRLYISGEHRKSKAGKGELFKLVLEKEKIKARQLVHTGDHIRFDIANAKKLGITACRYSKSELAPFEKRYHVENNLFSEICAGITKTYRTTYPNHTPAQLLGMAFSGPIFYGFILDTLTRATSMGINCLYFVARDAHLWVPMAEKIKNALNLDIEIRYFFCSRLACRFATMEVISQECMDLIFLNPYGLGLSGIADRVNMSLHDLGALFPDELKGLLASPDKNLSKDELLAVRTLFQKDVSLKKEILRRAAEAKGNFLGYLKQEGFFTHESIGFVDVGWSGETLDALCGFVSKYNPILKTHGFYFGFSKGGCYTAWNHTKSAYAFTSFKNLSPAHPYGSPVSSMVEYLLVAPHSTTVGFRKNGSRYEPILASNRSAGKNWCLTEYQQAAHQFVEEFLPWQKKFQFTGDMAKIPVVPLVEYLRIPDKVIGTCLATVPFSIDFQDKIDEAAPPLGITDCFRYAVALTHFRRVSITHWPYVSLMRSSPLVRCIFPWTFRLGNVLRRISNNRFLSPPLRFTYRLAKRAGAIIKKGVSVMKSVMKGIFFFPVRLAIKTTKCVLRPFVPYVRKIVRVAFADQNHMLERSLTEHRNLMQLVAKNQRTDDAIAQGVREIRTLVDGFAKTAKKDRDTAVANAIAETAAAKNREFAEKLKTENEAYHLSRIKTDYPTLGASRNALLDLEYPSKPFAFVTGYDASVTTALGEVMGQHPDIFPAWENVVHYGNHPCRDSLSLSACIDPFMPDETVLAQLDAIVEKSAGKKIIVGQSPDHVYSLDRLNSLLPEAKFICLLRDGRDVIGANISICGFHDPSAIEHRAKIWLKTVAIMERYMKRATNMLMIRLEDLAADPSAKLHEILEFVGVNHSPEIVDYMLRSSQPIYKDTSRWRMDIPVEFWPLVYEKIGPALERLGYVENAGQSLKEELERWNAERDAARELERQLDEKRRVYGLSPGNTAAEKAA